MISGRKAVLHYLTQEYIYTPFCWNTVIINIKMNAISPTTNIAYYGSNCTGIGVLGTDQYLPVLGAIGIGPILFK